MTERPRLSICVGTAVGWPEIEPCVRSFVEQGRAAAAEILVADGSGRPPPSDAAITSAVTWLPFQEKSVFRLVMEAIRRARGEVIALTEDHCTARPGWVEAILQAHREYPHAAAVGGAIENGADGHSRLRWASHLMTQGAHMSPLPNGPARRIANEANVSFKRWALEEIEENPIGFMTIRHTRALGERGDVLVNDDRIVVDHHEHLDPRATAAIHFDDGRTVAAFRRHRMQAGDWLRLVTTPILPIYRTARVVKQAWQRQRGRTAINSLPWLITLEYCHGAGEFMGYLFGPGRSPYGLR